MARLSVGLLLLTSAGSAIGDESWTRRSSSTGDLPVPNEGDQQTCCVIADLDGDGLEDFVVGERTKTPSVVWYKLRGERWDKHVIDDTPLRPEAGGVCCDVDRDGDLDLILGQDASGREMWWWENPRPEFSQPWKRRLIKRGGAAKHHDQSVADYDGDGRPELVSWNQKARQLLLFEIPENPREAAEWPSKPIHAWESGPELEGFPSLPVDVDLDGKLDVVGGGRWFKHAGGTEFRAEVIDDAMRFTQCAAGQLVRGGRPEIVFSPGDTDGEARWYAWDGGRWTVHPLGHVIHGHTCEVRDIDGDGNQDILIGEMGSPGAGDQARTIVWYGDGNGGFRETVVARGQGIHEGQLGDLDGDGDLDILVKPYHHNAPRVDVLLNPVRKRPAAAAGRQDTAARLVKQLSTAGIPLVDFHVHLRGGMTVDKAAARQAATGIRIGVLDNLGSGWPLETDDQLRAFLDSVEGKPLLIGVQVNDRDWHRKHSADLLARLDYVLGDTMIMPMPGDDSPPVKLWLADQYTIDDAEAWMERYVRHNLRVLAEPIQILANPTYLPPAVADRYDELWTDERMRVVIQAAIDNGVALEINAGGLPRERFLRLAVGMGAKFTLGTNNFDDRPIDMSRCLEAVARLGLEAKDMYLPRSR